MIDIQRNIERFLQGGDKNCGLQPDERYASYDYCFNYFQSFREHDCTGRLAGSEHLPESCLQIGFYLASWGMMRGSSFLLQKSARFYIPLIEAIAAMNPALWTIDVDDYTEENMQHLICCEHQIVRALWDGGHASATLVTKIMLGVFGNVPAFDTYLVKGLGIRWRGIGSLRRVADFYQEHQAAVDRIEVATLDFLTGEKTHRKYSKAKIVDMVGFIAGQESMDT